MLTTVGSALSGVIAVAITLMGARYLLDPRPAAAGFGIPGELGDTVQGSAWLAVKATRDIAMAIVIAILLINGAPRLLGSLMLTIALIPIADGSDRPAQRRTRSDRVRHPLGHRRVMLIVAALLIA